MTTTNPSDITPVELQQVEDIKAYIAKALPKSWLCHLILVTDKSHYCDFTNMTEAEEKAILNHVLSKMDATNLN